uniref:Uncharacterized protein n=1 Tax=Tanacetum cinerariifolium TaxID=118510 RepID=A0A6L2LTL4_TANCI|nr:hypothetical protein [Tanacetum cinerariifolium]
MLGEWLEFLYDGGDGAEGVRPPLGREEGGINFKIGRSGYGDIATLHFIWEGVDTFYVTGYDEHGSEIGGYNDLMMQQRRSRILVTFGNDPDYGHVLYGLGWEELKHCFDFINGKRVVLTNMLGNDLRMLVFGDDGYEINHENLPRTKVILDPTLKQETQKDPRMRHFCNWKGHSVVLEDEEAVFYQTFSRHVKNEDSLAIPPYFVTANDLFIFEHAKILILGKSLDEGLVPLMSNQDMLSLLQYVYIYKEIKVYVEKNTMEVVLAIGKGVLIEEVVEDDEVKEASKTGNSCKQLFDHPPWSSESMTVKRNKRLSEEFQFRKMLFDIDLTFGLYFSHETLEMKNEKKDPVNYQLDPYHGEDEVKENEKLFDEQDHLLKHVPFLKETIVIVDGDAPLLAIDALVVPPVIVLDEQLERPNKRRKLNPA